MNYTIIDKDGKRREGGRGKILRDGERIVVPVSLMDHTTVALHDGMGRASGSKPGYVFSGGESLSPSDTKLQDARDEYAARLTNAWRNPTTSQEAPVADADQDALSAYETRLVNAWRAA